MITRRRTDFSGVRVPWVTLGLGAAALVVGFSRSCGAALELDRAILAHGAWWRVFTAHFTHWSAEHLAWDLASFVACGWFVERHARGVLIATIVAGAFVVSFAVLTLAPEIKIYRGLSGIDSALFAVVAVDLARRARDARSMLACGMATAAVLGLLGKTALDLVLAHPLFIDARGAFVPVPVSHVAGIAAGFAVSIATLVFHSAARTAARSRPRPRFRAAPSRVAARLRDDSLAARAEASRDFDARPRWLGR